MLTVFHFGLAFVFGLGVMSDDYYSQVGGWFFSWDAQRALVHSALGIVACASGVFFISGFKVTVPTGRVKNSGLSDTELSSLGYYLVLMGCVLTLVSVATWFIIVFTSGGPNLLFGTYAQYLRATSGQPTGFIWIGMSLGLSLIWTADRPELHRLRSIAVSSFAFFALFALPIGLRGEVLFPLVAAIVIRSKRGRTPSLRATLIAVLIVLLAISVLKELRQVGLSAAPSGEVNGNISDGLSELGGTLRPVTEVIGWRMQGDDYIRGNSYIAPFDRALCRLFPGRDCVSGLDDMRLMNVLVQERVGPIGFSPIAEAFYNFGRTGIIVIMGVYGLVVGFLNRPGASPLFLAMTAVIFAPMLINVRNSFVPVPANLFEGFLLIGLALACSKFFPRPLLVDSGYPVSKELPAS